ncbi:hypothetical protein IscW_ISCW013625 [Ixodes scapularis]|uniref:Secreted protein n=1 Tax=Ixodes scapularis TaxID=6945 RepID=B7QKU2_IXOSC|nr:hypothetical protein IscW_ISCW013625 [Ixodes scapularis]|eukprot:XP_002415797.1 hypothetical protein IscW_ISCW013625 [Ixodes scapularis]
MLGKSPPWLFKFSWAVVSPIVLCDPLSAFRPTDDWGPAEKKLLQEYHASLGDGAHNGVLHIPLRHTSNDKET